MHIQSLFKLPAVDLKGGLLKRPATFRSSSHAARVSVNAIDLEGGLLEAACNF
jgi:hypothetical protein